MTREGWFGGQFLGSGRSRGGSQAYEAVDPASGGPLEGKFVDATLSEIAAAGKQANRAYAELMMTGSERVGSMLTLSADRLRENRSEIVARADQETALGKFRLDSELDRTAKQLDMFARLARTEAWRDVRIDHARPDSGTPDLRRSHIPIGPVAVFGASNFPLAFSVAGGDTASALTAGCPVIVKAHPSHPGTSELVARILVESVKETGLPPAIFQMVHGTSNTVGKALVQDPNVRAVGFTGSFAGGMALREAANARSTPIPVFAEMGSTNPVFLFRGALENRRSEIAAALASSVQQGMGQFCTKPGVIVGVSSPLLDEFLDEFGGLVSARQPQAMLNERLAIAYTHGVEVRASMHDVEVLARANGTKGAYVGSAVFRVEATKVLHSPQLLEELFGPAVTVVVCGGESEFADVASAIHGSLSVTVHAERSDFASVESVWHSLVDLGGRIVFNGVPTGVAVSPAMNHGGPFPATTDVRYTSVGTAAVERFRRPVCFQNVPAEFLPPLLRDDAHGQSPRVVDGEYVVDAEKVGFRRA